MALDRLDPPPRLDAIDTGQFAIEKNVVPSHWENARDNVCDPHSCHDFALCDHRPARFRIHSAILLPTLDMPGKKILTVYVPDSRRCPHLRNEQ